MKQENFYNKSKKKPMITQMVVIGFLFAAYVFPTRAGLAKVLFVELQ